LRACWSMELMSRAVILLSMDSMANVLRSMDGNVDMMNDMNEWYEWRLGCWSLRLIATWLASEVDCYNRCCFVVVTSILVSFVACNVSYHLGSVNWNCNRRSCQGPDCMLCHNHLILNRNHS
jgi:hypothetical protein